MNFKFIVKKSSAINHQLKNDEGFTMAELLVAMAVISILSVLTVTNIKNGTNEQALLRSAQTFASDIKKAQNLALSPKKYGVNPVCFYGIDIIDNSSYRLYYRDSANCAGLNQAQYRFNGQAVELEVFSLESGIQFAPPNNHDFAFIPPEPIILYNTNVNFEDKIVVLRIGNAGNTRTVTINKFGNVEVQ